VYVGSNQLAKRYAHDPYKSFDVLCSFSVELCIKGSTKYKSTAYIPTPCPMSPREKMKGETVEPGFLQDPESHN